jgi:nucleoid-associated protein YgaU
VRITKLHLFLIGIAVFTLAAYWYQMKLDQLQEREMAALRARQLMEQKRVALEQRIAEVAEERRQLATDAVAIAGEYWCLAKKEGRDVAAGQASLRQAKALLAAGDTAPAFAQARRAIDELKRAPRGSRIVKYLVRPGDTLWRIAQMRQHYHNGSRWPRIWRANKDQIPDHDFIRPRQVLVIPDARR